jgi:hypothetical protein
MKDRFSSRDVLKASLVAGAAAIIKPARGCSDPLI